MNPSQYAPTNLVRMVESREDFLTHAIADCRSQGLTQCSESLESLRSELGTNESLDLCGKGHFSTGWILGLAMRLDGQINAYTHMIPKLKLRTIRTPIKAQKKEYSPVLIGSYAKLPPPEKEVQFAKPRKWRFDFAWPKLKIAIEVEGGVHVEGRHVKPKGFLRDMEKYNTAASMGWLVFRVTPDAVYSPTALKLVNQAYVARRKGLTSD